MSSEGIKWSLSPIFDTKVETYSQTESIPNARTGTGAIIKAIYHHVYLSEENGFTSFEVKPLSFKNAVCWTKKDVIDQIRAGNLAVISRSPIGLHFTVHEKHLSHMHLGKHVILKSGDQSIDLGPIHAFSVTFTEKKEGWGYYSDSMEIYTHFRNLCLELYKNLKENQAQLLRSKQAT